MNSLFQKYSKYYLMKNRLIGVTMNNELIKSYLDYVMTHCRLKIIILWQVISALFGGILAYFKISYMVLILLSLSFSASADGYEKLIYEKVFVDLDTDTFLAGDTIQLKGCLIDATTGSLLSNYSRYVYIELISPIGTVECRKKLIIRDGYFQGYLPRSSTHAEGVYTISAYTLFMQNFPSKFFYKTQVKIVSPFIIRKTKCSGL